MAQLHLSQRNKETKTSRGIERRRGLEKFEKGGLSSVGVLHKIGRLGNLNQLHSCQTCICQQNEKVDQLPETWLL